MSLFLCYLIKRIAFSAEEDVIEQIYRIVCGDGAIAVKVAGLIYGIFFFTEKYVVRY